MERMITLVIKNKIVKNLSTFLCENKRTILSIFALLIIVESLIKKSTLDVILFGGLCLYGIFIKIFQIKSNVTFLLCIVFLIMMSLDYLLTSASISTEKIAVWFILFLAIGVIQQWRE